MMVDFLSGISSQANALLTEPQLNVFEKRAGSCEICFGLLGCCWDLREEEDVFMPKSIISVLVNFCP